MMPELAFDVERQNGPITTDHLDFRSSNISTLRLIGIEKMKKISVASIHARMLKKILNAVEELTQLVVLELNHIAWHPEYSDAAAESEEVSLGGYPGSISIQHLILRECGAIVVDSAFNW